MAILNSKVIISIYNGNTKLGVSIPEELTNYWIKHYNGGDTFTFSV